jgi:hypothetical protein
MKKTRMTSDKTVQPNNAGSIGSIFDELIFQIGSGKAVIR